MTTATFWLVALLAATKTTRDIHAPAPYEWAGELAAGILAMLVGFLAAYTLSLAVGADIPWPDYTFVVPFAPPYTGALV